MNYSKLYLLAAMCLLIYSCSKDEETPLDSVDNIELRQEQIVNQPLFNPCDAANLYVLVDLSLCGDETLWDCAVENAIEAYDNLPCGIGIGMTMITDISELPEGETVNITIDCDLSGLPNDGGGLTSLRTDANGISPILLGTNFENNWPCKKVTPSCCQMQKIVMHELGHALSLHHTQGGNGSNGQWIKGTPKGEANSIFNTSGEDGWCKQICDFTEGDLQALEILYPASACADVCSEVHPVGISVSGNLAPGQTIQVTSTPQDKTEYMVWAIFDGIPSRFFVHEQCGDQPLTTSFTLQNDPIMECGLRLYTEQCDEITNSEDYSLGSVSAIYPSIIDTYPQLGEEVEIKTVCNGKADYSVRLKYECSGQFQYQSVTNVNCNSSSSTLVTLWSNPCLTYSTVTIEGLRNGNIIGTKTFTIFP